MKGGGEGWGELLEPETPACHIYCKEGYLLVGKMVYISTYVVYSQIEIRQILPSI